MSGSLNRFTGKWIGQRYCIEQELGRGGMGAVYRAFHVDDPSNDVAIKLIHSMKKMSSSDLMRFQKEAALMSQLYHSNIIAFHELGIFQGEDSKDFSDGYYIVMDYARGKNLKDSLRDDGRKDLAFLFQVGLQVADALDYTHGKNIIHRDIKPQNIIISEAPGDSRGVHVRVLDFGVARLGNMIGRDEGGQEDKAGTPLYMAPEQSASGFGVPDHRVDLYSLGCVLYEILAGHAPFMGENRAALERAHQTAEPEPIQNIRPDIPLIVAQIIQKLLAKRPDDRYQTAFSLSADLIRAKALWEKKPASVPLFPLALKDKFFAVSAQLPIQGRAVELAALMDEYKQVAEVKARGRITLISGGSGMGKTRVLNEFRSILASQRIKFLSGVFTQHENALPFNALANAFNELLVRMAKTSPVDADLLARRLKQVVGPDSHLVAGVVPGLKPYLLEIPEPDDGLDVDDEKYARFAKAFSDFTRCLVPETQPLVLILDDVHWADDKSLGLIDQFFSNANSLRFHLVIGCRLDVASEKSAFGRFVAKFRGLKVRYAQIDLAPLDFTACQQVVGSMLRYSKQVGSDLVNHLLARSGGVPLRLVELTRRMVGVDMIRVDRSDKGWEWDVQDIQGAKVRLTAVDLVLGRIGDYKGSDLSILRAAACCGMSFQYEVLLLNGRNSPSNVVRLIEKSLDEGLIVRNAEPQNLKHLGKSYMFIHKKVRDAIYDAIDEEERRNLHGLISDQLLSLIQQPKDQMLFAVAQHLNKSRASSDIQAGRERLALKYNLEAGDSMKMKQGWMAAGNYFRIALEIVENSKDSIADPALRRRLIERLADVSAGQTNFKSALARYQDLLQQPMSSSEFAVISAKAAQLHLVCGNVSVALSIISKALKASGVNLPKTNLLSKASYLLSVFLDVINGGLPSSKMARGLDRIWSMYRKYGEKTEQMFAVTKLLYLYSQAGDRQSAWQSKISHLAARRELLGGKSPISIAIKLTADRAAIIARSSAVAASYRLFDLAEKIAKEVKYSRASGYVSLMRAMSIDYMKARFEDVNLHLREAIEKIDPDQDRIAYGTMIAFRQYLQICSLKLDNQYELNQELRRAIPTRNWLSAVSMALLVFSLLIQGKRQKMVKIGEDFSRRRKSVGARVDFFSHMISCMLYFARGEDDQTRASFAKLMKQWAAEDGGRDLPAWQTDFIRMFLIVFPALFEVEFGRQLARNEEVHSWLKFLLKTCDRESLLTRQRTSQVLVRARISELTGLRNARLIYDEALKAAKVEEHLLAQVFSYTWFGSYLIRSGYGRRGDYLNLGYGIAEERKLLGLTSYIEKIMAKCDVELDLPRQSAKENATKTLSIVNPWPEMVMQHMDFCISALNSDSDLSADMRDSVNMLKAVYPDAPVTLFVMDNSRKESVFYSDHEVEQTNHLLRSVAPYMTIRSTLILHLSSNPSGGVGVGVASDSMMQENLGETLKNAESDNLGATQVFEDLASSDHGAGTPSRVLMASSDPTGDEPVTSAWEGMQALVPIRAGGETVGLLVLGGIGPQNFNNFQRAKHDLDRFGAQLGVLLGQKFGPVCETLKASKRSMPTDFSVMGGVFFDVVPWLNTNLHGKLRREREASWYLGLNWTASQYLVLYCCIKGDAMDRDRLSILLMQNSLVLRELVGMMGQAKSDIVDIRNQMQSFLTDQGLSARMDDIMLSFSLFDRDGEIVSSGHYGPSRPVVMGVENRVTAFNEASLSLRDGRDLRYWEIFAPLGRDNVFIVSYDTSRIDPESRELADVLVKTYQNVDDSKSTTKLLETALEQRILPRYYLAVTRA